MHKAEGDFRFFRDFHLRKGPFRSLALTKWAIERVTAIATLVVYIYTHIFINIYIHLWPIW